MWSGRDDGLSEACLRVMQSAHRDLLYRYTKVLIGIQKYLLSPYCEKRAFFPPSAGVLFHSLSILIDIIYMCIRAPCERKERPTAGHVGDSLWGGLVLYGGASLEEA